jgi:hypothetical protein
MVVIEDDHMIQTFATKCCRFVAIPVMWRSSPHEQTELLRYLNEHHITDRGSEAL